MTEQLITRRYKIPFVSDHPAFIDYLFDHHHFGFNESYEESAGTLGKECVYFDGDIVYKWTLRDAEIGFTVVDHSAIVYGTINGEEKPVAQLDGLTDDDVAFLTHSKKKVTLTGGTGKQIIENVETGKFRFGPERFYPWHFIIQGTARKVCRRPQ